MSHFRQSATLAPARGLSKALTLALTLALALGACLLSFSVAMPTSDAWAAGESAQDTTTKKKRHPGQRLYLRTTCIACHGKDGRGAIMDYPNLAGQDAKYMTDQIEDILSGKRTGSPDATGNPRSAGMKGALVTPEGEVRITAEQIKEIVSWLTDLEPAPVVTDPPADPAAVAAGEDLYKKFRCRTCHGPDGKKPLKGYPFIAGQKPSYLIAQMKDIRDKLRTNGKSKTMYVTIKKASDEDIEQLAAYLSQIDRTAK